MSRLAVLAAAAALLALPALVASASLRATDPSAFAEGPGSPFVADAAALGLPARRVASSPASAVAGGGAGTLLAVFHAPRPYAPDEVAAVRAFLEDGGQLLVADPFGQANSLTAPFGIVSERVRLVEPGGDPAVTLQGRAFQVNRSLASALQVDAGANATVLSATGPGGFLDRDGNGTIDAADPQGVFPVAVQVRVGLAGGRVTVLADAGPFAAGHADDADHAALRRALLEELLPDGGTLLVDESRAGTRDPLVAALAAVHASAALAPWRWVLVAAALGVLAAPGVRDAARQWLPHRFHPDRFVRRSEVTQPASAPSGRAHGAFWTSRGVEAIAAAAALVLLGLAFHRAAAVAAGAVLCVALSLAAQAGPPRVAATRQLDTERPAEGTAVRVRIELAARGARSSAFEVRDALPAEFDVPAGSNWFRVAVPGRQRVEAAYEAVPALRGPHVVGPLVARTTDPLRLRAHETLLAPAAAVHVAPRSQSMRRIPFTTRVPTVTLGPHFVNRAGDGSEFHALRDYAHGDSLRSVNWKASARAGDLMVNQRVHESMTRLTLLLDARAVSGAGPARQTPLADGCRAALSVATAALRVRDRIQVVTYGNGVDRLPPAPGSRQLHELREVLSALPARGGTTLLQAAEAIGPQLKPNTPVMVLSGLEADPTFTEGVRWLRNRGLLPIVVASPVGVRPSDPADGDTEEGADRILRERARTLAELRALGVPVFETVQGLPLDDLFRIGGQR